MPRLDYPYYVLEGGGSIRSKQPHRRGLLIDAPKKQHKALELCGKLNTAFKEGRDSVFFEAPPMGPRITVRANPPTDWRKAAYELKDMVADILEHHYIGEKCPPCKRRFDDLVARYFPDDLTEES